MIRLEGHGERRDIEALLRASDLPVPAPADPPVEFLVAVSAGRIVGCVGLERHGECTLIRSVVVAREARRSEWGTRLVRAAFARMKEEGRSEAALVTLGAAAFFTRLGFSPVPRESLAPALHASPEFRWHGCGNGTWMLYRSSAPAESDCLRQPEH